MDSIINTFHIDWKLMVAQMLNFGVVFVVLYLFALKPLAKIMRERTEKIEKGIKDAKSNALLLDNTKIEYEKIIVQARTEADKIFQAGRKEAETKKTLMLEQAKEEIALMVENSRRNLENEKVEMLAEARKEIVSVAVKIAEKVLNEKIGSSFDEKNLKELANI